MQARTLDVAFEYDARSLQNILCKVSHSRKRIQIKIEESQEALLNFKVG